MASGPFLHSGAWVTAVTANDSTQKEELGVLRFENGKVYKYVQTTAASVPVNAVVEYSGTSGTVVRMAVASAQTFGGVAETALGTSFFGWICVQGKTSAAASATPGNALVVAATAGMLTAPTSASVGQRGAVMQETSTAAAQTSAASVIVLSCL